MKYRKLGKTGLDVSVVSLGTHQFSGEWAKEYKETEVREILECACRLGVNFIDTAECYGDHSVESMIGGIIKNDRGRWIVATKFGHCYSNPAQKSEAWSPSAVRKQLEDSLKSLRTDYIDIYQFHSGSNAAFDTVGLWSMLGEQVQAGKIRHLGISLAGSVLTSNDLRQLHSAPGVNASVIQVVYNRLNRDAEKEIFPFCASNDLGVLARVPLAKGFLAGHYKPGTTFPANDNRSHFSANFNEEQLMRVEEIKRMELPTGTSMAQWALAWCLKNPAVSSVIVGCKTLAQLEMNAGVEALLPA